MKEKDTVPVPLKPGDTVYCEGISAILGTVIGSSDDGWLICWHETRTTEVREDLVLVDVNTEKNKERAKQGHRTIMLHTDFSHGDDDDTYFTHASDMIADIIHAACDHNEGDEYKSPRELIEKALRAWEGDAEDNYVEEPEHLSSDMIQQITDDAIRESHAAGDENVLKVTDLPNYPEPPDYLADAWRRYQSGESQVSDSELRQIDEWRADVHEDTFTSSYTQAELELQLANARLPYAKKIEELHKRLTGPIYIVVAKNGEMELLDVKPQWDWQRAGFKVFIAHINGGDSLPIYPIGEEST